MNRRKALLQTSIIAGSSVLAPAWLASCQSSSKRSEAYSGDLAEILGEFSDTLLPTTEESEGAKAAGNGPAMQTIINDCFSQEDTEAVSNLLNEINEASLKKFKSPFIELSQDQKIEILSPLDMKKEEWYVKLKELSVYVYFTSEIGMQKALRYEEVPGRFDGCYDYKEGDKAWAWCFLTY